MKKPKKMSKAEKEYALQWYYSSDCGPGCRNCPQKNCSYWKQYNKKH